jgi:hypothetical protein
MPMWAGTRMLMVLENDVGPDYMGNARFVGQKSLLG